MQVEKAPVTTAANLPPRVPVIGAPGFPAPPSLPSRPGYQAPNIMAGYDPLINKYGIKPFRASGPVVL